MKRRTGIWMLLAAVLLFFVIAFAVKRTSCDSQPAMNMHTEIRSTGEITTSPEAELGDVKGVLHENMFASQLVAHALGGVDGYTYLNSKEGFEDSYHRGMRFIETDLFFSADGKLICSHGFKEADVERMGIEGLEAGNPPEYAVWNEMRFYNTYTTQDAEDILYYLETYPELYFEFDMRSLKGKDAKRMAEAVLATFGKNPKLFERILIQVYSEEMYTIFKEVFDFPVMQFYMTKAFCKEIDTYIAFCQSHEIASIAISDNYITEELLDKLLNSGIKIMVHTVDDAEKAEVYLKKGVDVICTNHLYFDTDGRLKSKMFDGDE